MSDFNKFQMPAMEELDAAEMRSIEGGSWFSDLCRDIHQILMTGEISQRGGQPDTGGSYV